MPSFFHAPPLGFDPLPSTHPYAKLHELLWPTSQPGDSAVPEPEPLARHIETIAPDMSFWTKRQVGDATAMDVDKVDSPPPAPPIRYINLTKHKTFAVHRLHRLVSPTFVVRQEYVDFMAQNGEARSDQPQAVFLTGQPGIGKSMGACYFLFRLLASGVPIFLVPDTETVYYFSKAGVYYVSGAYIHKMGDSSVVEALEKSWVLVDVDLGGGIEDWLPGAWARGAKLLVWTSSPREIRMRRFTNQFGATHWYMQPWSLKEITAVMTLDKKDAEDVRLRLMMSGPVARSLFGTQRVVQEDEVDNSVGDALIQKPSSWGFSESSGTATTATHRVFLIQPKEVLDEAGALSLNRQRASVNFLSNYTASRAAKAMDERRQGLSQVFDTTHTRSSAGKLVESMLHRALTNKSINAQQAFSVDLVEQHLVLLGKAETFDLESHQPDQRRCRPLYLQPQSSTFAAVDSILITESDAFLIQSAVGTEHTHNLPTLLRIVHRLQAIDIEVDSPPLQLVYCLLGTTEDRVTGLVEAARTKVKALRTQPQSKEAAALSKKAVERLSRLRVQGVVFDTQENRLAVV